MAIPQFRVGGMRRGIESIYIRDIAVRMPSRIAASIELSMMDVLALQRTRILFDGVFAIASAIAVFPAVSTGVGDLHEGWPPCRSEVGHDSRSSYKNSYPSDSYFS